MNSKMKSKVCLITGANSGIGRSLSLALAKYGAKVLMLCRDENKGIQTQKQIIEKTQNKEVDLVVCDVSLQQSIRKGIKKIKENYKHIDVLINNAGVLLFKKEITKEGIEKSLATNYLGPFLLTYLILQMNNPEKPCRIINVVSEGVEEKKFSLDCLEGLRKYNGIKTYSFSKQAEIYFTFELAKRLKDTNTTVNCFYPGLIQTNLGKPEKGFFRFTFNIFTLLLKSKFVPINKGIRIGLFLACSEKAEKLNGCYLKEINNKISVIKKFNKNLSSDLWNKTEKLILK